MGMESRPDPDQLLQRVQQDEERQARGGLKIFFGASAGVGKTYAMLEAAHERKIEGVDVVIGYIETHGRKETELLTLGLEAVPCAQIEYHGTLLREFDLDAALKRQPQLILVDELAHTNAPGARHAKRWQDIDELLSAGIDVYTTVNVQHVESLNDVVAQITGVIVRETIPDKILERADEIEVIDLPPDELLQRLKEGKVYIAQQAERAAHNFFRKGNLIALRELTLRSTADRIDAQMQRYRQDNAIQEPWPANERILVAISASPLSSRLVRVARRMAARLRAEWIAVHVETPAELGRPEAERMIQTLRLAEQLGAEVTTLSGTNVADELLNFARARNVSKIVVGKPEAPRWRELLFGSVVGTLIRQSGVIDVYVLSGESTDTELPKLSTFQPSSPRWQYTTTLLAVALCTLLCWMLEPYVIHSDIIMIYLLMIMLLATRLGRGPSILSAFLSVLAFDFFFVPPLFTLSAADPGFWPTFGVMLLLASIMGNLTVRQRLQVKAARQRERRTAALYALSREFASTRGIEPILSAAVRHMHEIFDSQFAILLPVEPNRLQPWGSTSGWWDAPGIAQMTYTPDTADQGVAQWVYDHRQMAGLGTSTLPGSDALYLPLIASQQVVGVLGVRPEEARRLLIPEQVHLLETFANQTALAVERARLADEVQRAQVTTETERLRSALLSGVSHELRTPLAVIAGATSSLVQNKGALDEATRDDLALTAHAEAERLNQLVNNLLDMTRLESGSLQVHKEWQPLEEAVGAALTQIESRTLVERSLLRDHPVVTQISDDLPLVPIDGALMSQVLINLLDNAIRYTPIGTPITISAQPVEQGVQVAVADEGPGLPPGSEQHVFEKFYRAQPTTARGGVGLGLTICRGIVEAHGGTIWAENRAGGGLVFRFIVPIEGVPPHLQ